MFAYPIFLNLLFTVIQMKSRFLLLALLVLVIIQSCTYDTDEIYERELNHPSSPPEITTVDLSFSMEEDTIILMQNSVLFHFQTSENEVQRVDFYVDDTLVGSENSENGIFELNHDFINGGYHILRIEVITNSGTGSIADEIGLEGYSFSTREWVFKVLDGSSNNVTTMVEDGFLKLVWDIPNDEVTEYIVYRGYQEVGRSAVNSFIDKGYVGEGEEFRIEYIGPNNTDPQYIGYVELPNEMAITYFANKNNKFAIQWPQPRYYAAVDSVVVFAEELVYETTKYVVDVNVGEYVIPKYFFGKEHSYKIMHIPKYYNPEYEDYLGSGGWHEFAFSNEIHLIVGYPSPIFNYMEQINNTELFYHTNRYSNSDYTQNDSLFTYSFTNEQIVSRYRYNPANFGSMNDNIMKIALSPNKEFLTAAVGYTGRIMYCPVNDPSDYSIHTHSSLNANYATRTPISNNGIGLLYGSGKKVLYNFINDEEIDFVETNTSYSDYNISFDGKYFFLDVSHTIDLYQLIDGEISLIDEVNQWSYDFGIDYFEFHENEPDKAVCYDEETKVFNVISLPALEILKSFSIPEEEVLDVNYQTNMILSGSDGLIVVRSLDDGSLVTEIPNELQFTSYGSLRLIGNSLFWKDGARYFLD